MYMESVIWKVLYRDVIQNTLTLLIVPILQFTKV